MLIFKVNTQVTESLTSPSVLQQCSSASLNLFNIPWRVFFLTVNKNMDWTSTQTYKPVPALLVMHSCSQETHPDSCIWWRERLKDESYLSIRDVLACITHYNYNICNFCVQLYHVEQSGRISWAEIVETWQLIFYFYPSGPKTFLCNIYYDITL